MRPPPPRRPFLPCFLAAAFLGVAGCVHDPNVKLDHAELNGFQVAAFPPQIGVRLTVVVNITNTNSFDVALRGMRGQVMLGEKYPLPITYVAPPPGIWLRAGQATPMRLPVDMPIELAIALLREAFASPVIGFHVTGSSTSPARAPSRWTGTTSRSTCAAR